MGFKKTAGFAAIAALAIAPLIARAETRSPLAALEARVSDPTQPSTSRHEAFLEILSGVDEIARRGDVDPVRPGASRCASFAFLFAELYRANDFNAAATLAEAPIFIGTAPTIYLNMSRGSHDLGGPLAPLRDRLTTLLAASYNRGRATGGSAETAASFVARIEDEGAHSSTFAVDWHAFQNDAAARLAGLPPGSVSLPLWLTTHGGGTPYGGGNGPETGDHQDPRWGYVQKKGDIDANGRHDHLIGTAMLGFAAESARIATLHAEPGGAACPAGPDELGLGDSAHAGKLARLEHDAEHAALWLASRPQAAYNEVRPANWLYTATREIAPYAEEYLRSGQNGSPTDAMVNSRGQKLGAMLAHHLPPPSAEDVERTVYDDICDESRIAPAVHGPLTLENFEQAFDSANKKGD